MKLGVETWASNEHVRFCKTLVVSSILLTSAVRPASPQANPPPQPGMLEHTLTAPKLEPADKLAYRFYRGLLIRGGIGALLGAGILQASGRPPEWGGGMAGYGKRYASAIGVAASRQAVTGLMEVATHQDPRFFPSTESGFKRRTLNVVRQVFVVKNDEGRATFASSKIVGAFAAGQIANSWLPGSSNSVGQGFERGALILAADTGVNFLAEFVPAFRERVFKRDNRP